MLRCYFENQKISKQFNYIITTFSKIYHIPNTINIYENVLEHDNNDMIISYGANIPLWQNNHIHIYESTFFNEDYLTKNNLPKFPLSSYNNLPVLYKGRSDIYKPFIDRKGNKIITNIDIIASSFFMLTRYEEVVNDSTEILISMNAFQATASIALKDNFLNRPIVNEYFELLWDCIRILSPGLERKPFWKGKDFSLCLTHDVDFARKYNPHAGINDHRRSCCKTSSTDKRPLQNL